MKIVLLFAVAVCLIWTLIPYFNPHSLHTWDNLSFLGKKSGEIHEKYQILL